MIQSLNRLVSFTGFELRRAGGPSEPPKIKKRGGKATAADSKSPQIAYRPPQDPRTDRLLRRPVFIISPVRSGSTALGQLLSAHSKLHAPHDLHLRRLEVDIGTKFGETAMVKLDLERADLEHLLWDRVMHRELVKSGKEFIVEKTPNNAFAYQRIAAAWPDARFIFLLRHPDLVAKSWHRSGLKKQTAEEATLDALRYMRAVERARNDLPGRTVHYEDLASDPGSTLKGICEYLGIDFEAGMLDHAEPLGGDATPSATQIPDPLREVSAQWGYLASDHVHAPTQSITSAHAELAKIWPKDDKIRFIGEIVGDPDGGTERDWRLLMVPQGPERTALSYPIDVKAGHFDVCVPTGDLVPPEGLSQANWDVYLATEDTRGELGLRLGRHLDGVEDKKNIMVFPEQTTTRGSNRVSVRPLYTHDNDLSVVCRTLPREPSDDDVSEVRR